MKTPQLIPAWMLYLLAPMVALAQSAPSRENEQVVHSPLLWYWVVALVVAAAAFALVSFRLSKRRQPPHRPSTP
jgi:tellurite resistance protein TehA-like permease